MNGCPTKCSFLSINYIEWEGEDDDHEPLRVCHIRFN